MKSLNRTLSLVLVLAMCLGMMGIASAATFTDSTTVQYKEAVSVMNGIGAINGYADGTFKPTATITREEAAKMICYSVLGPTVAAKLSVSATGFTDVAADRWSSPFVGYCVSQGIINGMGDGTFAPTANVTGYQLAKMMLAAAGYGKANEFTGASWELNVAVAANKNGIFTGAKAADFSAAATREEAALYVFNALTKVPQVTYSKLTESYTKATNAATEAADTHFNKDTYAQIAEDVYTTLAKASATVDGATGYFWKLGATTISGFVSSVVVLATSTDGTPYNSLVTDSNVYYMGYQADGTPTYYYNDGAASDTYPALVATDDTLAENIDAIKAACSTPGAIVKFLDTDSDGYYEKVSVTVKTVEKLAAAPTTTTSGAVTYVTVGTLSNILSTNITYPAGLVKNDIILWYQAGTKYYVEKATSVTGTISSYNANSESLTIDGKAYYVSALVGAPSTLNEFDELKTLLGKAGYTFYLDNGNNICYTVAPTGAATVSNTFFVAAVQVTTSFGVNTYQAAVVKPDGTQDAITVKKTSANADYYVGTTLTNPALVNVSGTVTTTDAYNGTAMSGVTTSGGLTPTFANGNLVAGFYYTYATNTDGSYNLTLAKNSLPCTVDLTKGTSNTTLDAGDTSFVVTGNTPTFLGKVTYGATAWGTTITATPYLATSSTIFMYYNDTTKTFTVKTGVTNALSYAAGGKIFVLLDSTGTYAQIVVCKGAASTTSASGYDQYFVTSSEETTTDANGTTLFSYTAVKNGTVGTAITSYVSLAKGTLYFAKDYATSGAINTAYLITDINAGATHTALADVTYASGVLTVDGGADASYILSDSVAIYLCNKTAAGTTVSQITAEAADALVYDTTNDQIFLVPTSSSNAAVAAIYIFID